MKICLAPADKAARLNIAIQEQKVCDIKFEIVQFVVSEVRNSVPSDRQE